MDEPNAPPAEQPPLAQPPQQPPPQDRPTTPQIVVQVGSGSLQRTLCWIGWLGFAVFCILFVGQSLTLQEYFDTTDGIQEKYYSGAKSGRDKVAVITVSGAILEGRGFVKKQIDRVREDDKVKAVVVRVNSPGGTITGSDYLYHHLKKLREEKKIPLVVSMGGIAASGGYYVSMAVGDQEKAIYAEPTTTTGSIGVIVPHYDLSGLLNRYEVKDDSIVSHPRKQLLSMTRPISEEDRQILQSYVDEAFVRFKEIVKQGRPAFRADPAVLDQLATGEIFTAEQARRHGLVDRIGFLEDAIDRAMDLARLDKDKTRVVEYERLGGLFEIPFLAEAGGRSFDVATLLELNTPQAYYLATTLPPLVSHHVEPLRR
jgi:protease-4